METIGFYIKKNITTLFSIYISIDNNNSNEYCVEINQDGCLLPSKQYYSNKEITSKYTQLINQILNTKNNVFKIEKELIKHHYSPEEYSNIDKVSTRMTLTELKKKYPNLHFEKIFKITEIKPRTITVYNTKYIQFLNKFIKEVPLKDWKGYLLWCLINNYKEYLTDGFYQKFFNFYGKEINGSKEQPTKIERTFEIVSGYTSGIIGEMYIKHFFNKKIIKIIEKMIKDIRKECIKLFTEIDLFEDKTLKELVLKLKKIKYKIGYPDKVEKYKTIKLTDDIFTSLDTLYDYSYNKVIKKYNSNKSVNKKEWYTSAYNVNAMYYPSLNEILITAGILQKPFFSLEQTEIENLAGIGTVIGHEIIHSLDDVGRQFDSNGNKRNWWTKVDERKYNKFSSKLIDQYNNYCVKKNCLNGKLTLGENFADYLGFTLAYRICKKKYSSTQDKIKFFKHFARTEKGLKTHKALIKQIFTDAHSPNKFRVNGVLSLIEDFNIIYNVSQKDKMFVKNKLDI
jgi:putative endopeptidase